MTIVAPASNELLDPAWAQQVTDAVNGFDGSLEDLESGTRRMGCNLRRAANLNIGSLVTTDIPWDAEDEDTDNLWSSGVNITVPTGGAGIWVVTATAAIQGGFVTTGRALIDIRPTSVVSGTVGIYRTPFTTGEDQVAVTALMRLAVGDTFKATVAFTLGANRDIKGSIAAYRMSE